MDNIRGTLNTVYTVESANSAAAVQSAIHAVSVKSAKHTARISLPSYENKYNPIVKLWLVICR